MVVSLAFFNRLIRKFKKLSRHLAPYITINFYIFLHLLQKFNQTIHLFKQKMMLKFHGNLMRVILPVVILFFILQVYSPNYGL